jgi:hypothetical protein
MELSTTIKNRSSQLAFHNNMVKDLITKKLNSLDPQLFSEENMLPYPLNVRGRSYSFSYMLNTSKIASKDDFKPFLVYISEAYDLVLVD